MRPIRSRQQREYTQDPWSQIQRAVGQQDEVHVLGDQGGIESYQTCVQRPCDCGCLERPAGFCAVCQSMVCKRCFSHCQCGKPLCPRHSIVYSGNGRIVRLCPTCHAEVSRKRRVGTVMRLLLSPFIDFGDRRG